MEDNHDYVIIILINKMTGTLLNYNIYEGETQITLTDNEIMSLGQTYREITGNYHQDELELIRSYQPSPYWYQGFKEMDRIDIWVYNVDLLSPDFNLLSFLRANREGKLKEEIRQFLAETVKLDPQFDSSDPSVLRVTKSRLYDSPLVVLLHKFTGDKPGSLIEELVKLTGPDQLDLVSKYEGVFNLVNDLYQTLILETPPLDHDIILFGSGQLSVVFNNLQVRKANRSESSFQIGTLDNVYWKITNQPPEVLYVPAGSRILPYYEKIGGYTCSLELHFLLPLGTQLELVNDQKLNSNHYFWRMELNYNRNQAALTSKLELFPPFPLIDSTIKIYKMSQSVPLRARSSFVSRRSEISERAFSPPLKYDLTTINYTSKPCKFHFPSRLSTDTHYNYELRFWDPQFLVLQQEVEEEWPTALASSGYKEIYQLRGNTADLLYRTKKFVTSEEPDHITNQFLNKYLPTEDWLLKINEYIESYEYHKHLILAYNVTGDRLINGYLREQLTFGQFLLRYLDPNFKVPEDPETKEELFDRLMEDYDLTFIYISQELKDLIVEKLNIFSDDLDSDLLEYAFFGSDQNIYLRKYDHLAYQLSVDLQNLILEAPPLDSELIVYRGITENFFKLECQPGEEFTMDGMISTSLTLQNATRFGCHVYIIRVPAGRQALPLNLPDIRYTEKEILLPHGSTFVLDKCLELPYLETIEFIDLPFVTFLNEQNPPVLLKACEQRPIHFYFCRLIDQPTVGP